MLRIRKILAPTDLSELSQDDVRLALEIGKSRDAEVTVYHVIEDEKTTWGHGVFHDPLTAEQISAIELTEGGKQLLATFMDENFNDLLPRVKISQAVELGVPYRKILDRATEERADLIVMSTH